MIPSITINKPFSDIPAQSRKYLYTLLSNKREQIEEILEDFLSWLQITARNNTPLTSLITTTVKKVQELNQANQAYQLKELKIAFIRKFEHIFPTITLQNQKFATILKIINYVFVSHSEVSSKTQVRKVASLSKKECEIFWGKSAEKLRELLKKQNTREAVSKTITWFNQNHSSLIWGGKILTKEWKEIYASCPANIYKNGWRKYQTPWGLQYRFGSYTEICDSLLDNNTKTKLTDFVNTHSIREWWKQFAKEMNTEEKLEKRWWAYHKNLINLAKLMWKSETQMMQWFLWKQ